MKGKRTTLKGGEQGQQYIGCYIDPTLKRRLRALAGLRNTTVSSILIDLVDQATQPVAHLVDGGTERVNA